MKSRAILLEGVHSLYKQYSAKRAVVKVESKVSGVYRPGSRLENLIYRIIFNIHETYHILSLPVAVTHKQTL